MTSGRLPDGDRWWNRGSRKRGYLRAPKTTSVPFSKYRGSNDCQPVSRAADRHGPLALAARRTIVTNYIGASSIQGILESRPEARNADRFVCAKRRAEGWPSG